MHIELWAITPCIYTWSMSILEMHTFILSFLGLRCDNNLSLVGTRGDVDFENVPVAGFNRHCEPLNKLEE